MDSGRSTDAATGFGLAAAWTPPTHTADARRRWAGMAHLLRPKLAAARRRAAESGGIARSLVLGTVGIAFWALLFGILYRLLVYFRATEGIGDLLAAKLLGLVLLAFLAVLLLSNIITALSSFFLARDLELVAAAPVDGVRMYGARLIETLVQSSWMVVLVLAPILIAYGWVYDGGWAFVGVGAVAIGAFLVLPAVTGSALTLALVNIFPARRARDLLMLIALFGAAALILLLRMLRPEQLMQPDAFRDLVDFVAALDTPSSIWLPSDWAADALMATLAPASGDLFPLALLVSTAAAAVVAGAWLHEVYYARGFSRAQEARERRDAGESRPSRLDAVFRGARLSAPARAMVTKDIRSFFRDTTQWSQLILLAVLVAAYVYNIRVLPLRSGEPVGFFLINVISFLNLGLAGFVLSAIAVRFLYPAVSLEGGTLWLLRSSPLDLRTLIWTKFWVGLAPLLCMSLALTAATNAILEVGPFMMTISLTTMTVMTFAIAALALGFGAAFPRFETGNAAQVAIGFGGLLFMMTATAYVAIVVVLEAWPVYRVLRAQAAGEPLEGGALGALVLGFGAALGLSILAIVVSLRVAVRRAGEVVA